MDIMTGEELRDTDDFVAELSRYRILEIPQRQGALLLEIHSWELSVEKVPENETRSFHLVDYKKLLGLATEIRRCLQPTVEDEILDSLERIEKKLVSSGGPPIAES